MGSIALGRADVVIGVDTHKDRHAAVAVDGLGGRLGDIDIAANGDGYAELLGWATSHGRVAAFGVEGTGSYGNGLARFLRRHGQTVIEVSRPPRKGERRQGGKSDPIDAEHAARAVLAGTATATPKLADGVVEAIRLVKIARDTAVKAHSQAMITLKATLVTGPEELRADLEPLTSFALVAACASLDTAEEVWSPDDAIRHVLASLARRWLELHEEIKGARPPSEGADRSGRAEAHRGVRDRLRHRRRAACSRRRQPRSGPVRGSLRQALRRLPHPCVVGEDGAPPAQPRREPPGERRALPGGDRPNALAPADDRVRGKANEGRVVQEGDHPLPQALPRAGSVRPAPSAAPDRERDEPLVDRLDDL